MHLPVIDDQSLGDTPPPRLGRRKRWPWIVMALAIIVPLGATLIGALTAPPKAARLPVGRLVLLEANEPSEHTTTLRALVTYGSDGKPHELVHEDEPQDTDDGSRDWINQPVVSPDGRSIAYVKQIITLQEEVQSIVNQICVMPLGVKHALPRVLVDLTKQHLKPPIGLVWSLDSSSVVFLNDDREYIASATPGKPITSQALPDSGMSSKDQNMSSTASPVILPNGKLLYGVRHGKDFTLKIGELSLENISAFGVSHDGKRLAYTLAGEPTMLYSSAIDLSQKQAIPVHPGWSLFGKRQITSVGWSPDDRYIAFTVSKPPSTDDELFYLDASNPKIYKLPMRTGRASWVWRR